MRTDVIVLSEPVVDDDLSLLRRREPLGVEHLMTQGSVEAFVVSILPRASGIDLDRFDADLLELG